MTEEKDLNEEMIMAFAAWRMAGEEVRGLEIKKKQFNEDIDKEIQTHTLKETDARLVVEALMNKNGITEDILPGMQCNYKVNFRQMPETVDIPDEKAVPDEFIKKETVKTIKKKELLKHLKDLRKADKPLPNWVTINRKPAKLEWELIKR